MRKKFLIYIFAAALASFFLTGCYPSGAKNLLLDEEFIDIDISEINIKNLTIDLKLPAHYPEEVYEIYPKAAEYDRTAFIDMFIKEDDVIIEERNEDYLTAKRTEDGDLVIVRDDSFNLYSGGEIPSALYTLSTYCDIFYTKRYFPADDTAFPVSEARERAEKLFSDIGFTNYGEPEIYYISAEAVNSGSLNIIGLEFPYLERDDEAYIFRYPIMIDDIPVMVYGKNISDSKSHNATRVMITITKDDVVIVEGDFVYSPDSEKGEPVPVIPPKEAFDIAIGNFSGGFIQYPTTLYDCKLAYMNIGEYESPKLVPVWEFDYYVEDSEFREAVLCSYQIIVDARTGRIY